MWDLEKFSMEMLPIETPRWPNFYFCIKLDPWKATQLHHINLNLLWDQNALFMLSNALSYSLKTLDFNRRLL